MGNVRYRNCSGAGCIWFGHELATGQGTVVYPPFRIADQQPRWAVGICGRDGVESERGSRPVPMVVVQVICPSLPVSCVQSARLPRYLCIEALDRVNLLVAAGMSDPRFHYVKRAVAAHRTNRDE